jgi:hypothetical protein
MTRCRSFWLAVAVLTAGVGVFAQQTPAPVVHREADRLLREMSATLMKAQRFALEGRNVRRPELQLGHRRRERVQ